MTRCEKDYCRQIERCETPTVMICCGKHPATTHGDSYRICLQRQRGGNLPEEDLLIDFNHIEAEILFGIFAALQKDFWDIGED